MRHLIHFRNRLANLRYASTLFIRGGGDFLHDMCDTRDGINNSAHGFPGRCHLIRPQVN
ncbi:Uncharacterised protein [Shigella sonnei]|nr:Uncharacterised protein [Shigella sonnei]